MTDKHDDRSPDEGGQADDKLAAMLRPGTPRRFEAGFADRVMARLARESGAGMRPGMSGGMIDMAAAMALMFRRLAVPAVAACLMLAAYNVSMAEDSPFGPPDGLIEAMFALVPLRADAALSL